MTDQPTHRHEMNCLVEPFGARALPVFFASGPRHDLMPVQSKQPAQAFGELLSFGF
jgi:hypothetical protein